MVLLSNLAVLSLHVERAEAGTIIVPDDYPTIQEAINNAGNGDTIYVTNGRYFENIIINKSLSLVGESKQNAIIDGSSLSTTINVTACNVTISDLRIQNGKPNIHLERSNYSTITNNIITNDATYLAMGIYLNFSSYSNISQNTVKRQTRGIYVDGNFNEISRNTVTANRDFGIRLGRHAEARYNVVSGNIITNHKAVAGSPGIWLNPLASNNTISSNTITSCRHGIRSEGSSNNSIYQNDIMANTYYAVYFYSSSYGNIISENNLTSNAAGIYFQGSNCDNNSIIRNNITMNNLHGIYIRRSLDNNIYGNNITENSNQGIWLDASTGNILRNNSLSGSNFNFHVSGTTILHFTNDVDTSNTIDENPIYYWIEKQNVAIPSDAGYIALINCSDVLVDNLNFTNKGPGLFLYLTNNTVISNNNISNKKYGILLHQSSNNTISGNNITNSSHQGIYVKSSFDNRIHANNITENQEHGIILTQLSNSNDICSNRIINNSYGIQLLSCFNTTISGNDITLNNNCGIHISQSGNNTISGNNITENNPHGIKMESSTGNRISRNNITENNNDGINIDQADGGLISSNDIWARDNGIFMQHCSNFSLCQNKITAGLNGMLLYFSSNNTVCGNTFIYCIWGAQLSIDSSFNTICENNFLNCTRDGTWLHGVSYNVVRGNNMTYCGFGVSLEMEASENIILENTMAYCIAGVSIFTEFANEPNIFFHNNFINNRHSCEPYFMETPCVWDEGYPFAGNYWSDYDGEDLYCGPYQNVTGPDGIGDTPYVIDPWNKDNYPLIAPFSPTTFLKMNVTKKGEQYPVELTLNATILEFRDIPGGSIKLSFSGMTGTSAFLRLVQPIALNSSKIKVFLNHTRVDFPSYDPSASLSDNGTHFFIYLVFPSDDIVEVSIQFPVLGDITGAETGVPDGVVDMRDIGFVARRFGLNKTDPLWSDHADVNGPQHLVPDGEVDMRDIGLIASKFGETYS